MTVRVITTSEASTSGAILATVESTASVFFSFVVGFVIVIGGGWVALVSYQEDGVTWFLPAGILLAAAEAVSLMWLKHGLEDTTERSRIPEIALQQPRWPVCVRPLAAAWWLAHVALAGGAMWLLENALASGTSEIWRSPALLALLVFGVFTISHTTHLYVLLFFTSLHASRAWVYGWWRRRFLVDVGATVLAVLM